MTPPLDDANNSYQNHIPEAIRRQSERADEIARQIGAAPAAEPEEEGGAEAPVDEAPAAEPTPAAPAAPAEGWEQRYRTLQGKYDAEVPALRARLSSLEQLLSNLQREPAPAAPAATATTTTTVVIPKEDEETFGADLITATRRWARAEVQAEFDQVKAELQQLKGSHQRVEEMTVQQRVMNALDADPELAGKWRRVNETPEFVAWLGETDPYSGWERKRLLGDAYNRGDAVRTGRFFKAYIAEHTAVTAPPAPAGDHTSASAEAAAPTLESMVAPGRAGGAPVAGGAPAEKRVWLSRDISAFYRDVQRGKFAGREAERLRIEQDIIAASTEGRVR